MKAIVSVFARDAKGITAYITAALAEQNINILDISQTLGEARGLAVHVQRQDIFDAMHRI